MAQTPKLWSVNFLLLCTANLCMTMSFYLLMPVLPFFLKDDRGMGGAAAGTIISAYMLGSLLIRPLTGYALDRWGRRGVFIGSFFVFALTAGSYPLLSGFAGIFVVRFLHGLFWGSSLTAGQTVAVDIIPKARRGEGVGIYTFFMSAAMALGPALGIKIYGINGANTVFLLSMTIGLIGVGLTLPLKLPKFESRPIALKWENFFEGSVLPVGLAAFMFTVVYGGLVNYVAYFAAQMQTHSLDAAWFYVVLAAGMGFARLKGGKLFDKQGPRRVALFAFTMLVIGLLSLWGCAHVPWHWLAVFAFYGASFLIGLGCGFCMPVYQTMVSLMVPMSRLGVANATYASVFELGIATGIIATGALSQVMGLDWIYFLSALWLVFSGVVFFRFVVARYDRQRLAAQDV